MTLRELDQAFGGSITAVIEPSPQYNSFIKTTTYDKFLRNTNDILASVYTFSSTPNQPVTRRSTHIILES